MERYRAMMERVCFLCAEPLAFGSHAYDGKHIRKWGVDVCDICFRASRDGLVPGSNTKLIEHLQRLNIPIQLNARGWIDWPIEAPAAKHGPASP